MRVGAQCHALTSLPQGKTLYPLSRKLDRPQGHSGWVHTIPPTDIQSQYHPTHSETHLYEYIPLTKKFVQKKKNERHSKRPMIRGNGEAGQTVIANLEILL